MDETLPLVARRPVDASVESSIVNVFDNFVGLVMLGLPWTFNVGGLWATSVGLVIAGLVALVSFDVLVVTCERSGLMSFDEIAIATLGRSFGEWVEAIRACYCFGNAVSASVLVCDSLLGDGTGLLPALFGWGDEKLGTRLAVVGAFHAVATLPLALSRTLEGLKHAATVALVAVFYATGVIVATAIIRGPASDAFDQSEPLSSRFEDAFRVLPLLNYFFMLHYNIPRYYHELRDRTPRRMLLVTAVSGTAVVLLYLLVGITGALTFGNSVNSNVLLNLNATNKFAISARIATLIIAATTFAKLIHPMRDAVAKLAFRAPLGADALPFFPHYAFVTTLLVATLVVVAALVVDIGFTTILSYNSCIFGTFIAFILPVLLRVAVDLSIGPDQAPIDGRGYVLAPHDKIYARDAQSRQGTSFDDEAVAGPKAALSPPFRRVSLAAVVKALDSTGTIRKPLRFALLFLPAWGVMASLAYVALQ
mmetsp:Transcript_14234/g.44913  ORF Transcript_14234/g.44913 Transcript_14234/m.44913 type:complete len:479 (-) Transcript_14234:29-1465(-)